MTNTNELQNTSKTFTDRAVEKLLRFIMDEMDGFEGTPDDWRMVLDVLEDGEFLSQYFGGIDTKDNQIIVEEAYAKAEETLDAIKDADVIKQKMADELRWEFEQHSDEEIINGIAIWTVRFCGLMCFKVETENTKDYLKPGASRDEIEDTIDFLINDAISSMDSDNFWAII